MLTRIFKKVGRQFQEGLISPVLSRGKQKIFCIGRNKTGTTSLARAFKDLGYPVGNQRKAELLLDDYIRKDFIPIIKYCRSAQVFQDIPFSYPELYKVLDQAYPGSKFILTVRDSPEQWYQSLVRYHSKLFGRGQVPTADDLRKAAYVYPGWIWKANRAVYSTPEDDPYNKEILIQHYLEYNQDVQDYFSDKDCLLTINVSEKGAYQKFCEFIGVKPLADDFPWENKTAQVKAKL